MTRDLPSPAALLVRGVRAWIGTGTSTPGAADDSLGALADYIQRHGLLALPADTLERAVVTADHPAYAEIVARRRLGAAIMLRQAADLADIVERLQRAGVRFVITKGQPLSAWLYGDAVFRHCLDIDLLVEKGKREHAARLLQEMGYAGRVPTRAASVVYGGAGCRPMQLDRRAPVDLHWRTWGARFPHVLAAEAVLAGTRRTVVGTTQVPVPRPEHAAVIVLTHVAKHVWYSLESVLSIALLARRSDIDWTEVRRIVTDGGVALAAAAGLRLANDILGIDVPRSFGDLVGLTRTTEIARHGWAALALPPGVFPDGAAESRAHLSWLSSRRDRLRYRLFRAAEPTYAEWAAIRLPPSLAPLYVPIRLTRLALRHAAPIRRS